MAVKTRKTAKKAVKQRKAVKLLSGGNPQMAKADGAAPVKAYIAAIPEKWKRDAAARVNALAMKAVPGLHQAVKWNSPFYGLPGQGWLLSFHCFTKYLKVAFFNGAQLSPLPPGASSQKRVRYLDIHEGDKLDEKQVTAWVKQAAKLPGWGKV